MTLALMGHFIKIGFCLTTEAIVKKGVTIILYILKQNKVVSKKKSLILPHLFAVGVIDVLNIFVWLRLFFRSPDFVSCPLRMLLIQLLFKIYNSYHSCCEPSLE